MDYNFPKIQKAFRSNGIKIPETHEDSPDLYLKGRSDLEIRVFRDRDFICENCGIDLGRSYIFPLFLSLYFKNHDPEDTSCENMSLLCLSCLDRIRHPGVDRQNAVDSRLLEIFKNIKAVLSTW
ncbi:MAG: hypothetical protein ACOCWO_05790 [Candidatus Muiribacteriaceae bacterium]